MTSSSGCQGNTPSGKSADDRLRGPDTPRPGVPEAANQKTFPARVYRSGGILPEIPDDDPVLVSEPVEWVAEFRFFVRDRRVHAWSPYWLTGPGSNGDEWLVDPEMTALTRGLVDRVLADPRVDLPAALVIDAGVIRGVGPAVVEADLGVWGRNLRLRPSGRARGLEGGDHQVGDVKSGTRCDGRHSRISVFCHRDPRERESAMNLLTDPYLVQAARWPNSGRQTWPSLTMNGLRLPGIPTRHRPIRSKNGHFGGEFSLNRMSWIKPNFLWMMYRSAGLQGGSGGRACRAFETLGIR